ncbi:hypothetical protein H6F93_19400 [Leptolyngbya sp. FACHB-671]|uniref:hypothetical protein n=1 Tax=Leptolyngbya sp. FACHB-671 TaxID=2692812 RepID=UPI001686706B|nr:hypothetical protein [Leptolyngbya sp. FACHB-671]MBD2069662.1 hypothetical protein [Leptolyngbya sp. FACHB-671]
MIRLLLATPSNTISCQSHPGLGALALSAFEGTYRFSGGRSVRKGIDVRKSIDIAIYSDRIHSESFNSDQLTASGRCSATLTPT